ncbi:adaptin ear-binding coat-associated protein 2 [Apiospora saccharicola]|uniref:Adaptin ear-binding coat-associated protein 2 n=1 Tax=Apiospora saccharicola TaxID=335842 RepID=A0ABR1UNI1_9PEZI
MEGIDPITGRPLASDAIQRILFIAPKVHVYNIPPMVPGKGHVAAGWTADGNKRQIFTARLRVLETAEAVPGSNGEDDEGEEKVKTDVVLEDASNGQLFAAAPYTTAAVVEPVSDSSRFFAVRVQDEEGRKASLGIGFEERSDAFDFSVALQEARKSLGWEQPQLNATGGGPKKAADRKEEEKRDYSLKEGETITVNLPGRFGRRRPEAGDSNNSSTSEGGSAPLSSFSLPPPPSSSSRGPGILPPPPSAQSSKAHTHQRQKPSAADLGFDDGQNGEFA